MRNPAAFAFTLLGAIALAAGCGGHSSGVIPPPRPANANSSNQSSSPSRPLKSRVTAIKTVLVGFARGQRAPAYVREINGPLPRSLEDISSQRSAQGAPVPTPSPWCPQGTSSTNYCLFVPPGSQINEVQWCTNCIQGEMPTLNVYLDSSHTPPPHFVVQAFSSTNTTPKDCSVAQPGGASSCTVTTCYQPFPTCYVESQ